MSHRNEHLTAPRKPALAAPIGWSYAVISTAALFASVWNMIVVLLEWGPRRFFGSSAIILDVLLLALWMGALFYALALLRGEPRARRRLLWISLGLAGATAAGTIGWRPANAMELLITVLLFLYFLAVALVLRMK